MFDSGYRRRALGLWEQERSEAERELTESVLTLGRMIGSPLRRLISAVKAWFTLT